MNTTFTHEAADVQTEGTDKKVDVPASVIAAVAHICRNCGTAVQDIQRDYCGKRDCDERAALRIA